MPGEIKFEIINNLGTISEGSKGWKKELNRISWNGRDPKYDIREWDEKHEKMSKGITLSENELLTLFKLIEEEIKIINENK